MSRGCAEGGALELASRRDSWAQVNQDLRLALLCSWLIASALSACVILAALILPERVVFSAGRWLQVSHHDGPCMLCGMTRALVALGKGNVADALALQRWSLAVVGGVLASCLLATALLIRRVGCAAEASFP
jgi:hypothetical protein